MAITAQIGLCCCCREASNCNSIALVQALTAEAERMARMRHADQGFGLVEREVAELQQRARLVVNRLVLAYICWFTYSSVSPRRSPTAILCT